MAIALPAPIAGYFEADRDEKPEAIAPWFAEDAIVEDDGKTHVGRDAIVAWKVEYTKAFTSVAEPFAIAEDGDEVIVTSHVTGDFPGNPIDLRYFFVLRGEHIARLKITP
ncbi:hypothetical protein J3E64_001019 [Sphingobium sp. OAS761]|uniref:nuclear transport factor 2 family protein n=1 Tax=Sphingobium sp. OAS761 TaxID=2817901 RepID=UPI00209ED1FA|nr:nuclear transport factor 2 family protein [Sphingobium sp. OAS761]MCP1469344.1 hypothetical protein [Sphingobium sp. OAS761]